MSRYVFKLPDLGEGTVEAELMEWHVKPGATVKEDDVIADVMTDKANVEIPSPVSGTVVATAGAIRCSDARRDRQRDGYREKTAHLSGGAPAGPRNRRGSRGGRRQRPARSNTQGRSGKLPHQRPGSAKQARHSATGDWKR